MNMTPYYSKITIVTTDCTQVPSVTAYLSVVWVSPEVDLVVAVLFSVTAAAAGKPFIRTHASLLQNRSVDQIISYMRLILITLASSLIFAFVRFDFKNHAVRAIQTFNGSRLDGKIISVFEAKYGRGRKHVLIEKPQHVLKGSGKNHNLKTNNVVASKEVKPTGSFKMVLTFDYVENKFEALNSSWLLNYFGEVRDWTENEANRSRIAWIEMYGMPLQAWSTENFNRIAEAWGTILSLDDNSIMGDSYNSVRAIVDTKWLSPINDTVHLVLNETSYDVFVREISMTVDEIQVNRIGKTRMFDAGRQHNDIQEEEICNKQENSVSTRCLFDDRCSDEVIKETQMRLHGDPTEEAFQDTDKDMNLS
ncbi:hypothetical protein PIB30_001390 [Stylosanthes scabra]|uniref:DUF4283 domain-containing protein n=1 Tax=Stylosanthes scabra TaxID=79078 RepID=A0ABU6Z0M5_9FABA|nr:hypothetical protein [Stylosanthes scabra]